MLLGAVIICIHSAFFFSRYLQLALEGSNWRFLKKRKIRLVQILNSDINKYAVDEREYTYFDLILYNFTLKIFRPMVPNLLGND